MTIFRQMFSFEKRLSCSREVRILWRILDPLRQRGHA